MKQITLLPLILTFFLQPAFSDTWEPNCARVAKNAIIGVLRSERPHLEIKAKCTSGGLCVERSVASNAVTYKVTGEYFSGAFAYDVTIDEGVGTCRIQSVVFKYAE